MVRKCHKAMCHCRRQSEICICKISVCVYPVNIVQPSNHLSTLASASFQNNLTYEDINYMCIVPLKANSFYRSSNGTTLSGTAMESSGSWASSSILRVCCLSIPTKLPKVCQQQVCRESTTAYWSVGQGILDKSNKFQWHVVSTRGGIRW